MSDTDTTEKEAITAFFASVQTAAKVLSDRLTYLAARRTFAVMQRAFDFPAPDDGNGNYVGTFDAKTQAGFRNPPPKTTFYTSEAMFAHVVDFVKKHPGYRVEQLATRLGTKPTDLARHLRKAVAAGKVAKKGYGRATKYHAGKKA